MIRRLRLGDGLVVYRSDLLAELGVPHAFSTRAGGVSPAPRASLHLGPIPAAALEDEVEENFRRLFGSLGLDPRRRVEVRQVHGAAAHFAREPSRLGARLGTGDRARFGTEDRARDGGADGDVRADAIVVDRPGITAVVRVADCVPVLLASESGACVAAVHSGWRGTVAGVAPRVLEALRSRGCDPAEVVAAVGPCIGRGRFEVGPEVVRAFEEVGLAEAVLEAEGRPRFFVDLAAAVRVQLERSGVAGDRIEVAGACTFEGADDFFSHRRDGAGTGRMAALVAPAGTA